MWDNPGILIALVMAIITALSHVIAVTVFVVKLGGQAKINHTELTGKIDVMNNRVGNVETSLIDLKNTDRRLSLVEDRQNALATRQGNMEQDNLLIRDDLSKLHQGLDRHISSLQRFNDTQFSKT